MARQNENVYGHGAGKLEFCVARDETFCKLLSNYCKRPANYSMSFPHLRPFVETALVTTSSLGFYYYNCRPTEKDQGIFVSIYFYCRYEIESGILLLLHRPGLK